MAEQTAPPPVDNRSVETESSENLRFLTDLDEKEEVKHEEVESGRSGRTSEETVEEEPNVREPTEEEQGEEQENEEEKPEEDLEEKDIEPEVRGKPRTTFKQISSEFPEFFKKFPDMREAFFREQEFSRLFPTVNDAKESRDIVDAYDGLVGMLDSQDVDGVKEFLDTVKSNDEKVSDSLVHNFLPALHKSSPDQYFEVVQPIIYNLIRNMYEDGLRAGNKNLENSALHLSKYAFNDYDFASGKRQITPKNLKPETKSETPERNELDKQKESFVRERFTAFVTDRDSEIMGKMKSSITAGLDPDFGMTESMQDIFAEKVLKEVDRQMATDSAHMARMNSLLKKAAAQGFPRNMLNSHVSAYLARANSLIPSVRAKVSKEMFGRAVKARGNGLPPENERPRHFTASPSTGSSSGSSRIDSRKIDYRKTSDNDIFEGMITERRK